MTKSENAVMVVLPLIILDMGNCGFFEIIKSNDFMKKVTLNRKFPQILLKLQILILIPFWEYKGIKISSR